MKIRRIRIENFRKFLAPVAIDGLPDGLVILAGDNEEGKSTVLAAIQCALFCRHRLGGEAAQAMQPFGSSLRPEISVEFELNGSRYTVRKAFCQRPEAELVTPGGTFSGDAVEDRLQDLLRFEPPGRGAAKVDNRGIWGLFWVDQGTSFAPLPISGTSREALVAALEGEVGQVLGGERGRALLSAIEQQYGALFTKRGQPRGDYKESLDRVQTLERTLQETRQEMAEYEQKVEHLGRVRARLNDYTKGRSLELAQARLKALEEEEKKIVALTAAWERAQQEQRLAAAGRTTAAQTWQARQELIRKAAEAAERRATLTETGKQVERRSAEAEAEVQQAEALVTAAREDLAAAQSALAAREQEVRRARLERDVGELSRRLDKATAAADQAREARRQAAAIAIDDKSLAPLEELEAKAVAAALRLETLATRLEFAPEGDRLIVADGTSLSTGAPLRLTAPATLWLEGFGTVTVTPGGDDLTTRRRAAEEASRDRDRALQAVGTDSLRAAREAHHRRSELLNEAARFDAAVTAHAPDGPDILRTELDRRTAELTALTRGSTDDAPPLEDAEALCAAAREACETATAPLRHADSTLSQAQTGHRQAREAWIKAQTELTAASDQAETLQTELERARGLASDEDLRAALVSTATDVEAANAVVEARRAELDRANPEEIRLRLDAARDEVRVIAADIDALTRTDIEVTSELRALGQLGLGEAVQVLEGQLERARARAARLERDARALALLRDALTAAERQAREAFLAPIHQRIKPYLRYLFPNSDLVLDDDNFGRLRLRREGREEPFDALSVGTREQLAILTRLAFADFLDETGQPAALILDDALVYADDERFGRMQLVLRRAAERLQILILTCRERDYRGIGAPIIRLADCHGSR